MRKRCSLLVGSNKGNSGCFLWQDDQGIPLEHNNKNRPVRPPPPAPAGQQENNQDVPGLLTE